MYKQLPLSALIGLILSTPLQAEEVRQHNAHVHGSVEMNIAQDGQALLIEITSPGMNIVGFEHHPENEQDHQKITTAIAALENANQLISINPSAKCALKTVHVHAPEQDEADQHHEGHEDHEHHDEHSSEAHKDHDHEEHHDHGDEHEEGHSEFSVEYTYQCEQISELKTLTTSWFAAFPTTHDIDVNVFTDKQQTAVELTAEQPTVQL